MKLTKYNNKRNFDKTNEPKGLIEKNNKTLRFVIQFHRASHDHYDFRLEWKGVLVSWAIPKGLSINPEDKRLAIHVEDHPISYINFSGVIPKGQYGAGTVEIFDKGYYECVGNFANSYKNGNLKLFLYGEKIFGLWNLIHIDKDNWLIIKKDEQNINFNLKAENNKKTLKKEPNMLKNNKKNTNLTKIPFGKIDVQLAKLTTQIPQNDDWLYEIKYDGYRILAYIENGKVNLYTRNGNDYTQKFKNISESLREMFYNKTIVFDGEVVSINKNGKTDFGKLQTDLEENKNNFSYVIFDILVENGKDLRSEKLLKRKEILKKLLKTVPKNLILSDYVIAQGKESFEIAKKLGLEGIVGKKINSLYTGTRNGDWIKIKCYLRQEFVIGGYTITEKNKKLSALLLGYFKNKKLLYVGKVGTGFTDKQRKELNLKFDDIKTEKSHFDSKISLHSEIIWLKPKLIAEVQYVELTKDFQLRQGSFIGLREDKKPTEVKLEQGYEKEK